MPRKSGNFRQFNFVATNLTVNFNSSSQVKEMLDPHASYQVIPLVTEVFSQDIWQMIIDILPLCENFLIDICLPFPYQTQGKSNSHHARFFLLNKKIIGIRIRTGQKWSRYRCQQFRLPQEVLKFYNENNLANIQNTCQVGQFYISIRGLKIAPLFSSQIQQNADILSEYQRYGCDAYSVIDDIQQESIYDASSIARKLLNKNEQRPVAILYTGSKTSIDALKCYWTNAFIVQGTQKKQANINPLGSWANIKLNINVDDCIKHRNYFQIDRWLQSQKCGENVINGVFIKSDYVRFARPFVDEKSQKELPEYKIDPNLKKSILYIWHLHNTTCQGQPFTVGVPFTEIVLALVYLINELKQMLKLITKEKKKSMLQIYHFPHNDDRTENFWPANLQICNEAIFYSSTQNMLKAHKTTKVFVFCENSQEFKYFKEKTEDYPNLFICRGLVVEKFLADRKIIDRNYLRAEQNIVQNIVADRTLDKLCQQILNKKYFTLDEMIKHFRFKNDSVEELIEAFTQIMPQKIRTNVSLNPSHNFLLTATKERITQHLKEICNKQLQNESNKMVEQSKNNGMTDLQCKIKQVREHKKNLNKQFSNCHCCQQITKRNSVKCCQKCKLDICYQCLAKKYSNRNLQLSQFQKSIASNCPVCNQTCRCKLCRERIEKKQKEEEQIKKKARMFLYEIKSCFTCQLAGRQRKSIDIECQNCHELYCTQCLKLEQYTPGKFYQDRWLCRKCRTVFVLRNDDSKMDIQMEQQREKQFIPQETSEGIKKMDIQEQQKKNSMAEESKTKKRSSSSSSSSSGSSSSSSSSSQSKSKKKKIKNEQQTRQNRQNVSQSKIENTGPRNNYDQGDRGNDKSGWQDKRDRFDKPKFDRNNDFGGNKGDDRGDRRGNFQNDGRKQFQKGRFNNRNSDRNYGGNNERSDNRNNNFNRNNYNDRPRFNNNQDRRDEGQSGLWNADKMNRNDNWRYSSKRDNNSNNLLLKTEAKPAVVEDIDY